MSGLDVKKLIHTLSQCHCVELLYLKDEAFEELCLHIEESSRSVNGSGSYQIQIREGELFVHGIRIRKYMKDDLK